MHNGIIVIGKTENSGNNSGEIGLLNVKFVHYPDCQQLIIWLPESGIMGYGNYTLTDINSNTIVERGKIEERLNGSVQLLFDTLFLPDNNYTLEIEHPKGGSHVLHFQKLAETIIHPVNNENTGSENTGSCLQQLKYIDGFGNIIPNEDELMREKAKAGILQSSELLHDPSFPPFEINPDSLVANEIINYALSLATEWGDNFQKSILSRMLEKYPELSKQTIEMLESYVKQIEADIYELAQQFIDGKLNESEIITKSIIKYPWLSSANASRLAGIGKYYAIR